MCITKTQICELNDIINNLNSIDNSKDRMIFLENNVEDVDFFLNVLKKINKKNLSIKKESSPPPLTKNKKIAYHKEYVITFFQENNLDFIVENKSKVELKAMYYAIYNSTPLSSDNKMRIAQRIKKYIHDMQRFDALLS